MDMQTPAAASALDGATPISRQIWDAKYRLKALDGTPIDGTIEDSWRRVAQALAAVEDKPELWEGEFYDALAGFRFLPAGRILSGAGSGRRVTLFNCFVMGDIADDLGAIFENLREAALTMQQGGGSVTISRPCGRKARRCGAWARTPPARSASWTSGTVCAARSCPPARAAAP